MVLQEDPELTSSMDTLDPQLHMNYFPPKKIRKLDELLFTTKVKGQCGDMLKRHTLWSCTKPRSQYSRTQ